MSIDIASYRRHRIKLLRWNIRHNQDMAAGSRAHRRLYTIWLRDLARLMESERR